MYLQTENEVARSSHSKCIAGIEKVKKIAVKVTNFEPLLAFTMMRTPTKLQQFLMRSFRDFVQTDGLTDAAKNDTCSQRARREIRKWLL